MVALCALAVCYNLSIAHAQSATPGPAASVFDDRDTRVKAAARRLVAAYPEALAAFDDRDVIWRDGTRTPLDDGLPEKPFPVWLQSPDLKDMFRLPYPAGADPSPPPADADPGRARNGAFFRKMYGDCRRSDLAHTYKDVAWLPSRSNLRLKATAINGVADRLAEVSTELDALPRSFDQFLLPPAGTYNCRTVAGSDQASAHGYGIAIDIAVKPSHYWRWSKPDRAGHAHWRNAIPIEIVRIFERHGFIWGGRWSHFDTMHFEYRPELLLP